MCDIARFDIFRGTFPSADAIWIETVEGLAAAQSRMQEIASKKPSAYFVFGAGTVLATVNTSVPARDTKELFRGLPHRDSSEFILARTNLREVHSQITELLRWIESPQEIRELVEALSFVEQAINATERRQYALAAKSKKAAGR